MEIISVTQSSSQVVTYTHDQWNKRNGIYGKHIIDAAETDSMVKFFLELLRAAPYVVKGDDRLKAAYGYFVHAEIVPLEIAEAICDMEIVPLTAEQVEALLPPQV